jgi:hypothetical protein
LEFLNKQQLNDIYETGKNMNFLLNVLGLNVDTKIEKLRENIIKLVNEGDPNRLDWQEIECKTNFFCVFRWTSNRVGRQIQQSVNNDIRRG